MGEVSEASSSQMQYNYQLNMAGLQQQQHVVTIGSMNGNSNNRISQNPQRISINYQPQQIVGGTIVQVPTYQQTTNQSQGLNRVVSQSHYQGTNPNTRSLPVNSVIQVVGNNNRQINNQKQSIPQPISNQRIIINPQPQQIMQVQQGGRIIGQPVTQLRFWTLFFY